LTYDLT